MADLNELTDREKLIVQKLCTDKTSLEISAELGISLKHLSGRLTKIYAKTYHRSRSGVICWAFRSGLVQ
jgi:DNA-binding CsgD family transcriptional regulator